MLIPILALLTRNPFTTVPSLLLQKEKTLLSFGPECADQDLDVCSLMLTDPNLLQAVLRSTAKIPPSL